MIKQLQLKNFKCYKELDCNFKSINILTGSNSAGKTTILQSILLYYSEQIESIDVNEYFLDLHNINGYDFLGFNDLLYKNYEEPFFHIKIDGNLKLFSEVTNYEMPIQHLAKITQTSKVKRQSICYFRAERMLSCYQKEGFVSDSYKVAPENNYLAFFLYMKFQSLKSSLKEDISSILKELKLIKSKFDVEKHARSFLIKVDESDITHVGSGLKSVLPIIVALLTNSDSIIVIENPELHLHPMAQVQFINKIIELAEKNNNQIFIETHSDHILNAIRVRIVKEAIKSQDVNIYFIHENFVTEIKLNENGRFSDLPEYFFDEYEKQLMELL